MTTKDMKIKEDAVTVRPCEPKDRQRVLDILNQAIKKRKVTALLTPVTMAGREGWFREHDDGKHPIYVVELDGQVVGWMAVTAYRSGREGFATACELSYYLDENMRHRGIGTILMREVIDRCRKLGYKHLMLIIFEDNKASRGLAEKFGFTPWGRFPKIIEIDGRVIDCLQYGRHI